MAMGIRRNLVAFCTNVSISPAINSFTNTYRRPTRTTCPALLRKVALNLTSPRLARVLLIRLIHIVNALPPSITPLHRRRPPENAQTKRSEQHIPHARQPRPHPLMPVRPLHLLQLPDPKRIERTDDIRNQTNAQYSQHGHIVYLHRHINIRVCGGGSRVAAVQRDHELAAAKVAVRVLVQYVLGDALEDYDEDGDGGEEEDYGRGEEEDAPAAEVAHGCCVAHREESLWVRTGGVLVCAGRC